MTVGEFTADARDPGHDKHKTRLSGRYGIGRICHDEWSFRKWLAVVPVVKEKNKTKTGERGWTRASGGEAVSSSRNNSNSSKSSRSCNQQQEHRQQSPPYPPPAKTYACFARREGTWRVSIKTDTMNIPRVELRHETTIASCSAGYVPAAK